MKNSKLTKLAALAAVGSGFLFSGGCSKHQEQELGVIHWKYKTPVGPDKIFKSGHGQPIAWASAVDWCKEMNQKYPEIEHHVERPNASR